MDLQLNRRRKQQKVAPELELSHEYLHDVSMYMDAPSKDVSLEEFEDLALDRLKLLRILEIASQKGLKMYGPEWKGFIYEELHKENLRKFLRLIKSNGTMNPTEVDLQARRADHYSHFILRLAYCRSEELRRWFLNRELELFKLRFIELSPQSVAHFLEVNNMQYKVVSEEEKVELREDLWESTFGQFVFETTTFYKVPFTKVHNLVRARKVLVKGGYAYVPSYEMVSCISTIFRSHLSENLAHYCQKLPELDDDRINDLLANLHNIYTGDTYSEQTSTTEVNLSNLNNYAKQHYPMCMRHVHDVLKTTHHLKHGCRLQYLFFLKAIGLSYEDCMQFWHDEFTKAMDSNKFEKQYAYSVKHAYGKVGRMQSYSAYSCITIIKANVGPGDQHGCPFKHWDATNLKDKLEQLGISPTGVAEITESAKKGHYQVACGKYFEHTHGKENKNVINHPNQYFNDSYELIHGQSKVEGQGRK